MLSASNGLGGGGGLTCCWGRGWGGWPRGRAACCRGQGGGGGGGVPGAPVHGPKKRAVGLQERTSKERRRRRGGKRADRKGQDNGAKALSGLSTPPFCDESAGNANNESGTGGFRGGEESEGGPWIQGVGKSIPLQLPDCVKINPISTEPYQEKAGYPKMLKFMSTG